MEKGLTKREIIAKLSESPHAGGVGKVKKGEKVAALTPDEKLMARVTALTKAYASVMGTAAQEDALFFAHLVAWNHIKGQVRDAKVALPVIALKHAGGDADYVENALAHLADLRPREFLRAREFAQAVGTPQRLLDRLTERYLRDLEKDYFNWERTAIQHRETLLSLYSRYHVKPAEFAKRILFEKSYAPGSRFAVLRDLKTGSAVQIAAAIGEHRLPFLAVRAALGKRLAEPDVLVAVIARMSPTELVTNMKALEKLDVKNIPAARAALEEALGRAATKKGASATALKASVAAAAQDDEVLAGKLKVLQEKQLDQLSIDGNWLVLGDRSGSMSTSIELAKVVSGTLARMVKGNVYLVFFDTAPLFFDVTGKTLEEIQQITKGIKDGGGTSIGCGLQTILDRKLSVDGIAVVTDGGENNTPYFSAVYPKYCAALGVEPTVYCYATAGYSMGFEDLCKRTQIDVQRFDVSKADYYSLPNVIQTMRVGRYSLLDEVMAQSLKTVDMVLDKTLGWEAPKRKKKVKA